MIKKFLKAFGIALGVLIALMILTPFLFKGKIRELAIHQANQHLNATVSLGDINISLFRNFPKVFIGLENLTILNVEPFQGDTLAHIPLLAVTVDLPDLINGSPYSVDKIYIREPVVKLRVMHDGSVNWDIAMPTESAGEEETSDTPSSFMLQLKSLNIKNGNLVYDDVSSQVYVVLKGLDHQLSGDLTANRTRLRTSTTIQSTFLEYGLVPYLNQAQIALDARIDADLENAIYRLEDNYLKINELIVKFAGSVGYVGEDLNLLLTFQAPDNTFKEVLSLIPAIYSRDFQTVQTDGTFSLDGFVKGVYNDEQLPAFKLGLQVADAWFKYPDLPDAVENIKLDAEISNPGGDIDNTVIDLKAMSFDILQNSVRGTMKIAHPVTDPDIDLSVDGKLDLTNIEKVYPLEKEETLAGSIEANVQIKGRMSDAERGNYKAFQATGSFLVKELAYQSVYFSDPVRVNVSQVNVSPSYLDLVTLEARLGHSNFKARGKIEDYLDYVFSDGKLKGNFLLDAGLIDLNELMAAGPEEDELVPGNEDGETIPDTTELSPFLIPDNIFWVLNASIDTLDYETIRMENLKGKMEVNNSKLVLNGLTMEVFGGKMLLNGSYETTDPSSPMVDMVLGLTNSDIGEMFNHIPAMEKYAPIASRTFGRMSGNINLASVLDANMMPLYETIKGLGNIRTTDLEVKGVNTLNALSNALKIDSFKELELDPLNISFQLMEGILNVKPIDIQAGKVAMNLSGWTSLNQEIGYVLNMKIPRSLFGGQANDVLGDMVNKANQLGTNFKLGEVVEIKALIDGTLTNPTLKVDLAGTGKGLIQEVKEEIKQEVINKAGEEAEKILQEAQSRADAIMAQAQKEADKLMEGANQLAGEARNQANLNAQKIENEAKDKGALAVLAAKKSADEVRKQGDKQAQKILDEAKKQSDAVLQKARKESDKIMQEARTKADSMK